MQHTISATAIGEHGGLPLLCKVYPMTGMPCMQDWLRHTEAGQEVSIMQEVPTMLRKSIALQVSLAGVTVTKLDRAILSSCDCQPLKAARVSCCNCGARYWQQVSIMQEVPTMLRKSIALQVSLPFRSDCSQLAANTHCLGLAHSACRCTPFPSPHELACSALSSRGLLAIMQWQSRL